MHSFIHTFMHFWGYMGIPLVMGRGWGGCEGLAKGVMKIKDLAKKPRKKWSQSHPNLPQTYRGFARMTAER